MYNELELTKHIAPHLFSSGAPHIHFLLSSATIMLVVWSANYDDSVLISKASSKVNLLPMELKCDRHYVILRTNKVCIISGNP